MEQANLAKSSEKRTLALVSSYEIETKERKEQERTRIKKILVLELLARTKGVIMTACEKAEISTPTFYQWMKDDQEFAENVRKVEAEKNNVAADILWGKVTIEKDGPSVRYYLDRKHPEYKPKAMVETVITGNKTLGDLIREEEEKQKNEHQPTGQSGADRENATDKEQAPAIGAVPTEPGAGPVLEPTHETQPHTES